mmetsp:Transcript_83543/g.218225  ORF Transcript_83543/g.218225 Transcript_83543/m.218225 type:complete len:233 (+) Transcript_83543:89-787(+)
MDVLRPQPPGAAPGRVPSEAADPERVYARLHKRGPGGADPEGARPLGGQRQACGALRPRGPPRGPEEKREAGAADEDQDQTGFRQGPRQDDGVLGAHRRRLRAHAQDGPGPALQGFGRRGGDDHGGAPRPHGYLLAVLPEQPPAGALRSRGAEGQPEEQHPDLQRAAFRPQRSVPDGARLLRQGLFHGHVQMETRQGERQARPASDVARGSELASDRQVFLPAEPQACYAGM